MCIQKRKSSNKNSNSSRKKKTFLEIKYEQDLNGLGPAENRKN